MSKVAIARASEAMGRVLDALGLKGQGVKRLVIVCDAGELVTVYVKRHVLEEEMDAIADGLIEPATRGTEVEVVRVGGLEVDQQGRVFVPAAEAARMRQALELIGATPGVGDAVRDLVTKTLKRGG